MQVIALTSRGWLSLRIAMASTYFVCTAQDVLCSQKKQKQGYRPHLVIGRMRERKRMLAQHSSLVDPTDSDGASLRRRSLL